MNVYGPDLPFLPVPPVVGNETPVIKQTVPTNMRVVVRGLTALCRKTMEEPGTPGD